MFHHFHGKNHLPAQGSLSTTNFQRMLDWLDQRYNLIGANEYLYKFNNDALRHKDICLSFDDALLCQYDLAIPVLNRRKLDVFFFVHSAVFSGNFDNLEIFRHFRTNSFNSIEDFYKQFFSLVDSKFADNIARHKKYFSARDYLSAFPFYSKNDKWFRYIRDQVLGPIHYEEIMLSLMSKKKFRVESIIKNLWMSESNLMDIYNQGHIIGLHSFDHPTQISKMSYEEQKQQYEKNYNHLNELVGDIVTMAHPCGDYNEHTLKILSDLGILLGFRSSLSFKDIGGRFEVPRNDHANIFKLMQK